MSHLLALWTSLYIILFERIIVGIFFFSLLALETKSEARKTVLLDKICSKYEGLSSSPVFVKIKICELVHTCNPSIAEVETGGHLGLADLKHG